MSDKFKPLDQEEKDLEQAIEDIVQLDTDSDDLHQNKIMDAARNTRLKKDLKSANLRLYKDDIKAIEQIAREAGMDYQPYLRSMIHKLATGQLIDTSGAKIGKSQTYVYIKGKKNKDIINKLQSSQNKNMIIQIDESE